MSLSLITMPRCVNRESKFNQVVRNTKTYHQWYSLVLKIREGPETDDEKKAVLEILASQILHYHAHFRDDLSYWHGVFQDLIRFNLSKLRELDIYDDGWGIALCPLNNIEEYAGRDEECIKKKTSNNL